MCKKEVEDGLCKGMEIARALFDTAATETFDGVGITRAAYGHGEQIAHDLVAAAARDAGLYVHLDDARNLYMSLPGREPEIGGIFLGSHLDSVPQGGNFDGMAGVLAGLASLVAIRESGHRPRRDMTVVAIRAEENAWFGAQHIGSRAALGLLSPDLLDTSRRMDTGRSLAEHMQDAGADLDRIRRGMPLLDRDRIHCFLELHIEQGPVLEEVGSPVGIVTGIRGNVRCREAICRGTYGHSGVVPRRLRHDAVFAASELVASFDRLWREIEETDEDLVVTFGKFSTDPAAHALTTIPGEVRFSFDARSCSGAILSRIRDALKSFSEEIASHRGVTFEFSPMTADEPVPMSAALRAKLGASCQALGLPVVEIMSGAGHDAADFAMAGIPSAMIFLRNQNGSHNPDEAMRMEDFEEGVRLLHWFIRSEDHA